MIDLQIYRNYKFCSCNALSIKPQTTPRLSSQIICEGLSYSFFVCFMYNILVLNTRVKGKDPQKVTLMNHVIVQQSYPDLYVQRCLLKVPSVEKIMKISLSMIESIAFEACLSVGYILSIYFWGAFKQGPLAPQLYHIRFKLSYKICKSIQLHGNLKYSQSALSGCTKRETFGPKRYISPNSITHITFS